MDYSPPGSSVHGILQARIWSVLLFPTPGDLPTQGLNPGLPYCKQILLSSESLISNCEKKALSFQMILLDIDDRLLGVTNETQPYRFSRVESFYF